MAITRKGSAWEWMQSWYILLTVFSMGLASPLAFIYVWMRVRRFAWFLIAAFYTIAMYGSLFFLMKEQPAEAPGGTPPSQELSTVGLVYFGLWGLSVLHSIFIRKKYLILLEAQQEKGEQATERLRTEIRAKEKVLDNRVDEALIKFNENDITVKLCRTLFSVLPFAPDFRYYFNIAGAAERLVYDKAEAAQVAEIASRIARQDDGVAATIKVSNAIDTADSGLGVVTGVRNVYAHLKDKDRKRTFEADPQQAADAVLKAMGLAYMISRLYEGSTTEKVRQFFDSKAGQELALYYAAAEIALPFTDNLLEGAGNLLGNLFDKAQSDSEPRFSQFLGSGAISEAKPILDSMTTQLSAFLGQVRLYTDPLLKKAQEFAPTVMNIGDSVTGGIATAVDFLPAWKFLGARLAAEACVERAKKELSIS